MFKGQGYLIYHGVPSAWHCAWNGEGVQQIFTNLNGAISQAFEVQNVHYTFCSTPSLP